MSLSIRNELRSLALGIRDVIEQSNCDTETKQKASAILYFYLVNPVVAKEPDFFEPAIFSENIEAVARLKWVPFLTHLLKTGYTLLQMELERLPEVAELDMSEGSVVEEQLLLDNFVLGLAEFYAADQNNYAQMRNRLIQCIMMETTYVPETLSV